MIHATIEGGKEIEKRLMSLERKVAQKIVKSAARTAFKPTLAVAKSNAGGIIGGRLGALIAKSLKIYTRSRRSLRRGEWGLTIRDKPDTPGLIYYTKGSFSSLATKKTTGQRYHLPSAVEYGHAFPGRGGRRGAPKDVSPTRFLKPAFDSTKGRATQIVANEIRAGIARAV